MCLAPPKPFIVHKEVPRSLDKSVAFREAGVEMLGWVGKEGLDEVEFFVGGYGVLRSLR